MKTILINSPLFREHNKLYDEDALPPLGLGYIGTVLRENGLEVDLIDAVAERIPLRELINTLNEVKPAYVASNIFTTNYELVKELVESIQFKTYFIIGGLSTKQLYKDIFDWTTDNPIDVVTGDGELITAAIIRSQLKEAPLYEAPGRRYFMVGKQSDYEVKNLDDVNLDRSFFVNEPIDHPLGFWEANIVTSRGCIYNCTFCAAARSLNRDYSIRERSEQSITAELGTIRKDYPHVESIRVLDDLFLKTRHTVQKAINVFSGFGFQWRSMAHVMTFHKIPDHTMQELKASGCHELFIGIESGSPKVLGAINKTKDIDTIITNLTKAFKAGINIKGYFIYGFPDETKEDMEMTYQLAAMLKKIATRYKVNFRTSVFQYRPYHGTQIYHDLESEGYNLQVKQVQPNRALSSLVGRLQFNFHNGNYSKVDSAVLNTYIYRTINLNDGSIFAGLGSQLKADQY